jgi:hypothetical protein
MGIGAATGYTMGNYALATGFGTRASGNYSYAEGRYSAATGESSHAEGYNTIASGLYSHAEGFFNNVTGDSAHAECEGGVASGFCSHTEGYNTTAGEFSHSEGYETTANAFYSHAEGLGNSINGHRGSHIMGMYGDADNDYSWFLAYGVYGARALAAKILYNGNAYIRTAWHDGGMDYAECFETSDGKPIDPGYFVTFDGTDGKIRKADASDGYILGVVSATPCVIGDAAELRWKNMYLTDKWGRVQYRDITVPEKKDDRGRTLMPEHVETQPALNPQWDATQKYIPRSSRPEWVFVGMLGKLLMRDDGACQPGGYCMPNADGIATASDTGYRVMKRTDEDQILILFR